MENKNPFYYSGYCNLHKRSYIGTCPICVTGVQLDPPASPPSPAIEGIKWVCPECGRIYDSKPASCSFCNSGPTFPTEGEEELDRLESFNREEVKNILMEFSYDFQQEKYGGCSTHRHIVSLFIKAHRELFSTPTPPAGAEGEGEKKLVHPEDLKQVEKTILEVLDTYLSAYPVPANFRKIHIAGKQRAANYLALWMTGFWGAMDKGAEQWRSDFMDATEKLSAAHNMIAGLKERLRITLSNFDVETADLRIARDRIAELQKQLAEDDIRDAVRKYRDAHPEPQEDESWERRKIDRLCDVIGISEDQIRELEDEVKAQKAKQRELVAELQKQAADKEALEVRVKQLQEWHDSHLG